MRTLAFISAAVILWTNVAAADSPRRADEILKAFEAAKSPRFDRERLTDRDYVLKYLEDRKSLEKKQSELAWELYQSDPSHERAVELLLVRWDNMRLHQTAQAIEEMGAFVKDHPGSPRIADVLYARADGAMRNDYPDLVKGKAFTEDFIRKVPHDERGAQLLGEVAYYSRGNAREQRAIYRRIAADYAGTPRAKMAAGALRRLDGIGKPIELTFDDVVSGKPISLSDLRGKVVVLHFWSTTCGPCLGEFPALKEIFSRHKDDGVEFIGVSLDHPAHGVEAVKKCIADHQIPWPQYYQGNGSESEFSQSWGVSAMPSLFVVDRDGNLFSTEAREHLESIVSKALSKPTRQE